MAVRIPTYWKRGPITTPMGTAAARHPVGTTEEEVLRYHERCRIVRAGMLNKSLGATEATHKQSLNV
jgi:hypothetical protein